MTSADAHAQTITIGGRDYDLNGLSDQAKAKLLNIQFCDDRIQQLSSEWAIADTARLAYSAALRRELVKA